MGLLKEIVDPNTGIALTYHKIFGIEGVNETLRISLGSYPVGILNKENTQPFISQITLSKENLNTLLKIICEWVLSLSELEGAVVNENYKNGDYLNAAITKTSQNSATKVNYNYHRIKEFSCYGAGVFVEVASYLSEKAFKEGKSPYLSGASFDRDEALKYYTYKILLNHEPYIGAEEDYEIDIPESGVL